MHRRAFLHPCAIAVMAACACGSPALAQTFNSPSGSTLSGGTLPGGTLSGGTVGAPVAAPPPVAVPASTPAAAAPGASPAAAAPGALPAAAPTPAGTGAASIPAPGAPATGAAAMGAVPGAAMPQPATTPNVTPLADPSLARRVPVPRSSPPAVPPGSPQTGALAIPAAPPAPARPPLAPAAPAPPAQPARGLPPGAPQLFVTGGVYSPNAKHRLAIVNGQVVREGAEVAPGVVLEQITARDVVLGFRGARYRVVF